MKMNITITQKTGRLTIYENKKIAEITICNGNWKYWETYMETTEKQTLTMNNIGEAILLAQPVKDAYPIHDHKAFEEERKIIVKEAHVRTYNTLHYYLTCRIANLKEDYKKYGWTDLTANVVLFEDKYIRNDKVTDEINYELCGLIEIKLEVVE